jgi:hypothetical protein
MAAACPRRRGRPTLYKVLLCRGCGGGRQRDRCGIRGERRPWRRCPSLQRASDDYYIFCNTGATTRELTEDNDDVGSSNNQRRELGAVARVGRRRAGFHLEKLLDFITF